MNNKQKIAIIPFDNLSDTIGDEYFSQGITDELLFAVTKIKNISVISRTSSYYLKNKSLTLHEIAEALHVDYILEGSVRKADKTVRISVQLVKIENETLLFSEIYETELTHIFQVQTDIASKIADKLKGVFTDDTFSGMAVQNSKAFDYYLKGNYHWYRYTKSEIELAIANFKKAIKLEPEFALAHSGLAKSYIVLGAVGYSNPNTIFPKAKEASRKALLYNNKLVEAHLSSAWVSMFYDWDLLTTKKHLDLSLRLNPNNAAVYASYSKYFIICGQLAKAEDNALKAIEIDPMVLTYHADLFRAYYFMEKYDQALAVCNGSLEIDPTFFPAIEQKGWIYTFLGELDKAIETFTTLNVKSNSSIESLTGLGYAYARAGFVKESKDCFETIKNRKNEYDDEAVKYHLTVINIGLRNYDQAYTQIKSCIENKIGVMVYQLLCNPVFHQLKTEQRFITLFKEGILIESLYPEELSSESVPSVVTIFSNTKEKLRVNTHELLFVKADNNYCTIYWKEGNRLQQTLLRITLSQLERQLAAFPFMVRCHKSFLINLKEEYTVTGNSRGYFFKSSLSAISIPISRIRAKQVLASYKIYHQLG